jgi:hypothetical protein
MESIDANDTHCIKLEDGQQLKWPWKSISSYWEEGPADDILSVILTRPGKSVRLY